MDLSFRRLKHLVTVAETQNFSRAAELLNLSQPALSKSVSVIEEAYGVRLFERTSSGVHVTSVGAPFIDEARRLLNTAKSFDHNFRMIAEGERGNIALGVGPTVAILALSQLIGRTLTQGSGIFLSSEIRPLNALMSNLVDEEIELLIAENGGMKIPEEIEYREVGHAAAGFFVRNGHPLENRTGLKVGDLMGYPLACQEDPRSISGFKHNKNHNIIVCDCYNVMNDVMQSSDMVCIFPRQFLNNKEERKISEILLDDWEPRKIPIIAGWLRGRILSPIARQVIDDFCAILAEKT